LNFSSAAFSLPRERERERGGGEEEGIQLKSTV